MFPVADLHCDLLSFLANTPSIYDPKSQASYPQMQEGGVSFQTLAIFTESTKKAFSIGKAQLAALEALLAKHKDKYKLWNPSLPLLGKDGVIHVLPAFENADGFAAEDDSIESILSYLESLMIHFPHFLYIGLTWNGENRFGGGCGSKKGLKEEGEKLLTWMSGKKIAVDLSHASDYLVDDIFNYLDKRSLDVPVIASHSNARAISSWERNLPDVFIKELFARKGILGLNLFAPFLGTSLDKLQEQVEHLLFLGGENHVCLGADFFPLSLILTQEELEKKYHTKVPFFQDLADASCYPNLFFQLHSLSEEQKSKISHKNLDSYLRKIY